MLLTIALRYVYNFHTIVPGLAYRSPQPSAAQLKSYIKQYHIKTVFNLRGPNSDTAWYPREKIIAQEMLVQHYDFPFESDKIPPQATLNQFIGLLMTAPRPILIHCEQGADRSGLGAAILNLLSDDPKSLEAAKKQVSIRYFVLKQQSAGKQVLNLYSHWLETQGLTHTQQQFFTWLKQLN
jgi:protein tyrosine/serine phosphatase